MSIPHFSSKNVVDVMVIVSTSLGKSEKVLWQGASLAMLYGWRRICVFFMISGHLQFIVKFSSSSHFYLGISHEGFCSTPMSLIMLDRRGGMQS